MGQFNATDAQGQIQGLANYVTAEAAASKKGVRNQLILTAVVLLILVGYFLILNSQVKKITEPKELAKTAAVFIDDNIPDVAKMLESMLNDVAPKVADFVGNKAVKEGVPYLVKRSENMLDGYIDTMTRTSAEYMDTAFSDLVTSNKESLLAALKEQPAEDEPSKAFKPMRDNLHRTFTEQTNGQPSEAKRSIDRSLTALKNLNNRLRKLASADPASMNRKEALGTRILQTYWQFLHKPKPEDHGYTPPPNTVGSDVPDITK